MKIFFAARMARFDLLRAVQGLAARVTKWSADCDKALHRLVCYINSTLEYKQRAFIGDKVTECKLWLFADADHAGEYDNRSAKWMFVSPCRSTHIFSPHSFQQKADCSGHE